MRAPPARWNRKPQAAARATFHRRSERGRISDAPARPVQGKLSCAAHLFRQPTVWRPWRS